MPRYLSVLKLTGTVDWRLGTSGSFTNLTSCQSFDTSIVNLTTAQFRLRGRDASVEVHEYDDPASAPPCPRKHSKSRLMVLNRDISNLKKRRAKLAPRSRKATGAQGKKRQLNRPAGNTQIVQVGQVILQIKV